MALDSLMKSKRASPVRGFGALSFGVRDDALVRQNPSAIYQELMMTTPYAQTHRDVSYANNTVSLHSHEFYELLLCRSDCSLEYLVGADRYSLQKGDIILIRPGVSHRPLLRKDLSVPYRRDVLWVSTDLMEVLAQMDEEHADAWHVNLLRTKGSRWEFLCDLFHEGVKESEQKNPGWRSMVLGNTIQLLTQLMRACREGQDLLPGREQTALLERIMAYLEENFSSRITLTDTANHFFVSESTITHTFHNEMGVSFYRCLTQLRLIHAKTLMRDGFPLSDIGQHVGFADYSTFFRAFKKEYGISPKQYMLQRDSLTRPAQGGLAHLAFFESPSTPPAAPETKSPGSGHPALSDSPE